MKYIIFLTLIGCSATPLQKRQLQTEDCIHRFVDKGIATSEGLNACKQIYEFPYKQ